MGCFCRRDALADIRAEKNMDMVHGHRRSHIVLHSDRRSCRRASVWDVDRRRFELCEWARPRYVNWPQPQPQAPHNQQAGPCPSLLAKFTAPTMRAGPLYPGSSGLFAAWLPDSESAFYIAVVYSMWSGGQAVQNAISPSIMTYLGWEWCVASSRSTLTFLVSMNMGRQRECSLEHSTS